MLLQVFHPSTMSFYFIFFLKARIKARPLMRTGGPYILGKAVPRQPAPETQSFLRQQTAYPIVTPISPFVSGQQVAQVWKFLRVWNVFSLSRRKQNNNLQLFTVCFCRERGLGQFFTSLLDLYVWLFILIFFFLRKDLYLDVLKISVKQSCRYCFWCKIGVRVAFKIVHWFAGFLSASRLATVGHPCSSSSNFSRSWSGRY